MGVSKDGGSMSHAPTKPSDAAKRADAIGPLGAIMHSGDAGPDPVAARIVKTARQEFMRNGFRGVTMDDLAREMGMSKKTLYAHFPRKIDLVRAVMLDKLACVEADLDRISKDDEADFQTTLRRLFECMHGHMTEIQPAFARDVQRDAPELFVMIQARRREFVMRYIGKILDDGRKIGMIRKDIPRELLMKIMVGIMDAIMIPAKIMELGLAPREVFSAVIKMIYEGILTDLGRHGR
jgi:AcrR family transcriptional regulator